MALASVIIPCFNLGAFLEECVASVQAQGVPAEILVVDDASDDPATLEVLARLEREGIRVLRVAYRSLGRVRNAGVAHTSGRYVLFLDADDALGEGFLRATIDALERRADCGVAFTDIELFGMEHGTWKTGPFLWQGEIFLDNYMQYCSLVRRQVLETHGGFDPELPTSEDWDFWMTLQERGVRFVKVTGVVARYRRRWEGKLEQNRPAWAHTINRLVLNHRTTYGRLFLWPIGDREASRAEAMLRAWEARPGDPGILRRLRRTRLCRQFRCYNLAYRAWRRLLAPMYVWPPAAERS